MVKERFIDDMFRYSFPPIYGDSFMENHFCEVLFSLKSSGYLCLVRGLCEFASRNFENIFVFEDLLSATTALEFERLVQRRHSQFLDD